jgi:hypothetical protein
MSEYISSEPPNAFHRLDDARSLRRGLLRPSRGQAGPRQRSVRLGSAGKRPDDGPEKLDRRSRIAEVRQRLGEPHGRAPVARIGREGFVIEPPGGRKVSLPAGFPGPRDGLGRRARSRSG